MKKGKKKKEVTFNPTYYDKLTNASLEKWIREFLLRNDKFINDCDKFLKLKDSEKVNYLVKLKKKYKVYIHFKVKLIKNHIVRELNISLPEEAVNAFRIFPYDDGESKHVKDLRNKIKTWDSQDNKKKVNWSNYSIGLDNSSNAKRGNSAKAALEHLLWLPDQNGYYPPGDTLLLAINLNMPKETIERDIQEILKIHKQRRKGTLKIDKWKYYIIVYDLRQKNIPYEEIEQKLSEAYSNNEDDFDIKNLKNYFERAVELINGDYKKYI
jgi:hypothetical protein